MRTQGESPRVLESMQCFSWAGRFPAADACSALHWVWSSTGTLPRDGTRCRMAPEGLTGGLHHSEARAEGAAAEERGIGAGDRC